MLPFLTLLLIEEVIPMPEGALTPELLIAWMAFQLAGWIAVAGTVVRLMMKGSLVAASQQDKLLQVKDQQIADLLQQIVWLRETIGTEAARGDLLASNQTRLLEANELTHKVVESIAAVVARGDSK
jgi:hypothetical protein